MLVKPIQELGTGLSASGHGRPNIAGAMDGEKQPLEEVGVVVAVSYQIEFFTVIKVTTTLSVEVSST